MNHEVRPSFAETHWQELGHVVDLVADNNPAGARRIMLLEDNERMGLAEGTPGILMLRNLL